MEYVSAILRQDVSEMTMSDVLEAISEKWLFL